MLKVVDHDRILHGVYDPVFTDTGGTVLKKLYAVIQGAGAGGSDFNNLVRRTVTAAVIQL